jgi:hypothetical protein
MFADAYEDLTEEDILVYATPSMGDIDDLQVDWEHDQWWVTNRMTGAQWSVVETSRGLDFEQVTEGEWDGPGIGRLGQDDVLDRPYSLAAMEASERADETDHPRDHEKAAGLHYQAAQKHERARDTAAMRAHGRETAQAHDKAARMHMTAYAHHLAQVPLPEPSKWSERAFGLSRKVFQHHRRNPHAHMAVIEMHWDEAFGEDGLAQEAEYLRREGLAKLAAPIEALVKKHRDAIRRHEDALYDLGYESRDFDFDPDRVPEELFRSH